MLKYYDIINRLSDSDKIHILTDINILSNKNYRALGIPEINIASIDEFCFNEYPSSRALANTWDRELIGGVADRLIKSAEEQGIGFLKMPSPKTKINPYRSALSEDPFLASEISREYLKSAQRADISAGIPNFGLRSDELEWLDEEPDQRFIYEHIVKPFSDATENTKCAAILTEQELYSDKYAPVNPYLSDMVSSGSAAKDAVAVCPHVSAEKNASHLERGGLFFEGSASALESALAKYKQLKKDIETGNATTEDLEHEVLNGKAISPETIDLSLDRLLDFVFSAKRKPNFSSEAEESELSMKATLESAVLLKNDKGVLPIKPESKICIIGDIALREDENGNSIAGELKELFAGKGYSFTGISRGYDLSLERNNENLAFEAVSEAKKADIVLLFLGYSEKQNGRTHKIRKISIPANQQVLLDKLGPIKEKVVAVLPSDDPADVGIPDNCAAIMMLPLSTKCCAKALCKLLSGEVSPSGRLANTVYFDTESQYSKYKTKRKRDGIKVGSFYGYRYYDTSEECVGFPFGHGIGYTEFSYSALSVEGGLARLTVKNEGKMPATETVQIYVGRKSSNVIRPRKELCGLYRVELMPGERKNVEIPYKIPKIYSVESKEFVEESGVYTVYAGASVSDIRLEKDVFAGSSTVSCDGKKISDYIHTESNIITDNFKLEAKFKAMKRSVFNFVAGAAALLLAIILKMFCVFAEVDQIFFDWFAIVMGIAGIIFFIVEAVSRNRIHKEEQTELDKLNGEIFESAEQIPVYDAEKMFVDEFDTVEDTVTHEFEEHVDTADAEYFANIDKEQNFETAASEFEIFAAERGLKLRAGESKKIFAALSSSRLLFVNGMNDKDFKAFMLILANYFETSLYIDCVDETYVNSDRLLFKTDSQGNRVKTNANFAINAAKNQTANIHFAGFTNVKGETLPAYFTAFVNYVKNPLGRCSVTVINDKNKEASYYIPQNLWFVLNLAEGEAITNIPDFVAEVATVNNFEFDACPKTETHTEVRKFSYYQLDYLTEKNSNKLFVDENIWKKIDRLEEYVNGYEPFRIGNKLWLCLEKFAYVYMACGGDQNAAVDEAVAAKLITSVIASLNGKLSADDRSLAETVEIIFGEDFSDASKKMIEASAATKA